MASKVEIFNDALIQVGANTLTSPDENTPNATICRARFNGVRDAVLRAHPWNSVTVRKNVAKDTDPPAFGFSFQYTLPPDPFCLRPFRINDDDRIKWKVEGRKLLTDEDSPLQLEYIARITDTEQWDSLLTQAVVLRLAWAIAYKVTRSRPKETDAKNDYLTFLTEARQIDAQEGTPQEVITDFIIEARN